jgi:hypothetical protein
MSACTETCDELGFPTDAYDVGCQLERELTAANERAANMEMLAENRELAHREDHDTLDVWRQDFETLEAEFAAANAKSANIVQMIHDKVSQMHRDSNEDNLVDVDDVLATIEHVGAATGNRCDDDSLWFNGKDWQEMWETANKAKTALEELAAANAARGQIDGLKGRIAELNAQLDGAETAVGDMPERLAAANERIAELTMRVDRVLASTPNIGLAMAEDLSKRCDYAFALCGPENVNWADAGQFFLAGYDHARKAWRTADRDGTKGAS